MSVGNKKLTLIDAEALDEYALMLSKSRGAIQPAVQYVCRREVLEKELAGVERSVVAVVRQEYILKLTARLNALDKAFEDRYVTECSAGDVVLYTKEGGFSVGKYVADDMIVHSFEGSIIKDESGFDKILCVIEETLDRVVADDCPVLLERGKRFMMCGFAETYQNRLYVKRWPGDSPVGYPAFDPVELGMMDKVTSLVMKLRGFDVVDGPYR